MIDCANWKLRENSSIQGRHAGSLEGCMWPVTWAPSSNISIFSWKYKSRKNCACFRLRWWTRRVYRMTFREGIQRMLNLWVTWFSQSSLSLCIVSGGITRERWRNIVQIVSSKEWPITELVFQLRPMSRFVDFVQILEDLEEHLTRRLWHQWP